jgi:hypothetical protein
MSERVRVGYLVARPGKASRYISQVGTAPIRRVYIVCRVSKSHQRSNLADQMAHLRSEAARLALTVVGEVCVVANAGDPLWLATAAYKAKKLRAALLAETTCRFVRSPHFSAKLTAKRQELPSDGDYWYLHYMTGGVPLLTVADPDAAATVMRSCHRKRGQQSKGRFGGRPEAKKPGYKKNNRIAKRPIALQMKSNGKSLAAIARELEEPKSTVQRWVKNQG